MFKFLVLMLLKVLTMFFAMAATSYAVSPSLPAASLAGLGSVAAYFLKSPMR